MGKPMMGSINLSKLNANAKLGHSAYTKAGKDNDIFINVTLWINDEPDKFGNTMSVQLNPKQESGDEKVYFGNFKPSERKEPEPIAPGTADVPEDDDLPF